MPSSLSIIDMKLKVVSCLLVLLMSGCVVSPVKPWERDILARDDMQLDYDELIDSMDEQISYSKEASFGGKGIGGGGCGCN